MEKGGALFLVLFLLELIYGALLGFIGYRYIKIQKLNAHWNHTKVFYIVLLVQIIVRTLFFVTLLAVTLDEYWVFIFITIPE
jgi:hypothetical protein